MHPISPKTRKLFEEWGRSGGRKRARRLAASERRRISERAAHARWGAAHSFLSSVRLENPKLSDPTYLEEILSYGTWKEWHGIYWSITNKPFGAEAAALEKVCSSVKIYGAGALWKGLLHLARGASYETDKTKSSF